MTGVKMNARTFSMSTRAIRPSTRCLVLRTPMQRRFASSEQQPSQISQFYKTFTRPVAKVLLLAFFTYQLAYWAWVKLEQDEIVAEREAYIAHLEDEIAVLTDFKYKGIKKPEAPSEDQIRDYQLQLMELEQRNRATLEAMKKAQEEEAKSGTATGTTKASSWWKVW